MPISQEFLSEIARQYSVSDAEYKVLSLSVEGQSTPNISKELKISQDLVRKRLSDIYKKFQIEGRGPVKLAKLHQLLQQQYDAYQQGESVSPAIPMSSERRMPVSTPTVPYDWGEAPDIPAFYGRDRELQEMKQWILEEKSRFIALTGMGGVGKTTLTVKLAREVKEDSGEFERPVLAQFAFRAPLPRIYRRGDRHAANPAKTLPSQQHRARDRRTDRLFARIPLLVDFRRHGNSV